MVGESRDKNCELFFLVRVIFRHPNEMSFATTSADRTCVVWAPPLSALSTLAQTPWTKRKKTRYFDLISFFLVCFSFIFFFFLLVIVISMRTPNSHTSLLRLFLLSLSAFLVVCSPSSISLSPHRKPNYSLVVFFPFVRSLVFSSPLLRDGK